MNTEFLYIFFLINQVLFVFFIHFFLQLLLIKSYDRLQQDPGLRTNFNLLFDNEIKKESN